ncbi:hypothetical protein ACA910_012065 [Epithemia clementina (nom. ined.)]
MLKRVEDDHEVNFIRLLELYAPDEIFSDRNFMLAVCRDCPKVYALVDEALASDREFLEAALERNAAVLGLLPHDTQLRHKDLVFKTISNNLEQGQSAFLFECNIYQSLHTSFWKNKKFARAWINADLGFPCRTMVAGSIVDAWLKDRELCLAYAIRRGSFYGIPRCRGDIAFMLEIVDHHPSMFLDATGAAATDFTLMTAAFACSLEVTAQAFAKFYHQGRHDIIQTYPAFLRKRLSSFETFSSTILATMLSTQSIEVAGSNLSLLDQGMETSQSYKQILAEYLDIPTGKWLRQLQQAEGNVCQVLST